MPKNYDSAFFGMASKMADKGFGRSLKRTREIIKDAKLKKKTKNIEKGVEHSFVAGRILGIPVKRIKWREEK